MKTVPMSFTHANRYASRAACLALASGIRRTDGGSGSGVDVKQY